MSGQINNDGGSYWDQIDASCREKLDAVATTLSFPKGYRLYTQGEPATKWLYRIEEGEVELCLSLDAEDAVIGHKGPGEFFGWLTVFPDKVNSFSVVTATETTVRIYPQKNLIETFRTNASLAGAVARVMDDNTFLVYRHVSAERRVSPLERVETFPFRKRVMEIMKSPVLTCSPAISVSEAAGKMKEEKVTSIVITDREGKSLGIMTEKDFLRAIITDKGNLDVPIKSIMTAPVTGISPDSYIYQAMGFMWSRNIRHLPVLEHERPVGMITVRDITALRSGNILNTISQIEEERDPKELGEARKQLIPVVRSLLEENTPALHISRLISHVNSEIHRRAILLTIEEMGPPPLEFCFFVTGSHGREENHLHTDQDHGIILSPYRPERHNEIDKYFIPFSEKVCDKLSLAGFPYCEGNVMCRNPVWRKTLPEWEAQLKIWMRGTDKIVVRYLTLMADIAPIYGNETYVSDLKRTFHAIFSENMNILRALLEEASEHKAPIGIFSRIITERNRAHKGEVDLKKSGITFMVEALRILAIKKGIMATGCIDRLDSLMKCGTINTEDGEFLQESYRILYYFLLRTQLRKITKGDVPDTYLKVYLLSALERQQLSDAFRSVKKMQSILHSEFGNIFY